jgi:hypothetical protein
MLGGPLQTMAPELQERSVARDAGAEPAGGGVVQLVPLAVIGWAFLHEGKPVAGAAWSLAAALTMARASP